jgi:hypothetical protein
VTLYERLADLPLRVADWSLDRREADTSSGFTRVTTVVSLVGPDGTVGHGEDVTYETEEHEKLLDAADFDLAGEYTVDSLSTALDDADLFPAGPPEREAFEHYRRWGFESAALDLALRQANTDLASALGRSYDPVRFVVSTRLGSQGEGTASEDESDLPTGERVHEWLAIDPDIEFKLDPTTDWTKGVVADLAATDAVRILDLKGKYEGTTVDADPDSDLYRLVVESFPDAIVEDPAFTDETRPVFDGHEDRVSWDAPMTGVESIEALPFEPTWLNVKPSRFGSVESLLDAIEHCEERGVRMYGGGQFELDVGREHLHALASTFYPDAPNDVAPKGYNEPEPREGLPSSPLQPPESPQGLGFGGE